MEKEIEEAAAAAAAVVTRRFGDEQSNLLDQFERRSFEVHLNQAMQLGRSLSEPGAMFLDTKSPFLPACYPPPTPPSPALLLQVRQVRRHRRPIGLKKFLRKLLRSVPIIVRSGSKIKEVPDHKDPRFSNVSSRTVRI